MHIKHFLQNKSTTVLRSGSRTVPWTCRRQGKPAAAEPVRQEGSLGGRGARSCDPRSRDPRSCDPGPDWDVLEPARPPAGSSPFPGRACPPAPHQSLEKGARALRPEFAAPPLPWRRATDLPRTPGGSRTVHQTPGRDTTEALALPAPRRTNALQDKPRR